MKKSISYLLALIAVLASCAKTEVKTSEGERLSPDEQDDVITLTANLPGSGTQDSKVTLAEGDDKKTLKVSWVMNDTILVTYDDGGTAGDFFRFFAKEEGSSSQFTSTGAFLEDGDSLFAYYPYTSSVRKSSVTFDLSQQEGTLDWCAKHAPMYATGPYSESGTTLDFDNKAAILKINLTLDAALYDDSVESKASFVSLTTMGGEFANTSIVGLDGECSSSTKGRITANIKDPITLSTSTSQEIYLVVPAQTTSTRFKITAGDYTAITTTEGKTFEPGKYYRLSAKLQRSGNIEFMDANVKAICVENWDLDGDGELSYTEAAKVTSLGGAFRRTIDQYADSDTNRDSLEVNAITSFDELQYFTGLTELSDLEFDYCIFLKSITLPNNLKTIGDGAFMHCESLAKIYIPASVETITAYQYPMFYMSYGGIKDMKLAEINVDENNQNYSSVDGVLYNKDKTELLRYPIAKEGSTYEFPSDVKSSLKVIANRAFYYCYNLNSITLPEGVTTIRDNAFELCINLTYISLPSTISSLGRVPFNRYLSSEYWITLTLYCYATVPPTIEDTSQKIYGGYQEIVVYVPSESVETYKTDDAWSEYADYINAIE